MNLTKSTISENVYFAALAAATVLATGLVSFTTKYIFKDELKLTVNALSAVTLALNAPVYAGFLLGILRDSWQPFKMGDRFYLIACPLLNAVFCVVAAALKPHLGSLICLFVGVTASGVAVAAVANAVLAAVGKERGLSGRLATCVIVIPSLLNIACSIVRGAIIEHLGWQASCYISATIALGVSILGFWCPRRLTFRDGGTISEHNRHAQLFLTVSRLLRDRGVLLSMAIAALWNFAAGWGTPLFFHFTEHLRLSPSQFEMTASAERFLGLATSFGYGFLCLFISARRLLFGSLVLGTFASILYTTAFDFWSAIAICGLVGAMSGMANAAIQDLTFRSAPKSLEGGATMLVLSAVFVLGDVSDLLGAWLYGRGGFDAALWTTVAVNALAVPLVVLVPSKIIGSREGNRVANSNNPSVQAVGHAEVGGNNIDVGSPRA